MPAKATHQAKPPPKKPKPLLLPPGPPKLATREQLKALLDHLTKELGLPTIEIIGAKKSSTEVDRVSFEIDPGGAGEDHAWKIGYVDGAFGIMGGSYNSHEIEFTELASDFTGWVWIKATWTLTVVEDYVNGATNTAAVLETGASVPADDPDTAIFYVALVQLTNGKVASQAATRSISATVCDSGNMDGTAAHTILQS
jgi:hypothetical protein